METTNNAVPVYEEPKRTPPEDIIFSDATKDIQADIKYLASLVNVRNINKILIQNDILLEHINRYFQNYPYFQEAYRWKERTAFNAHLSLLQKQEILIDSITAYGKEFVRIYFQKRRTALIAERMYHYAQGIRDGIKLFGSVILANENLYNILSELFDPEYRYDYLYPAFHEKYDHLFSLENMKKKFDAIDNDCNLSDSERFLLFDTDAESDYVDSESTYLYHTGITEGVKLSSQFFLK